MIPHKYNLSDIPSNLHVIRSAAHCIEHEMFMACPAAPIETDCISSIMSNETKDYCLSPNALSSDYSIRYFKSGALVHMKYGTRVLDLKNNAIVFQPKTLMESVCAFVPRSKSMVLDTPRERKVLFPASRLQNFLVKPDFVLKKPSFNKPSIQNLTLPTFQSTLQKYDAITRYVSIDYTYIVGLACACTSAVMAFIMLIGYVIYRKCCVFDIASLFATDCS